MFGHKLFTTERDKEENFCMEYLGAIEYSLADVTFVSLLWLQARHNVVRLLGSVAGLTLVTVRYNAGLTLVCLPFRNVFERNP